MANKNTLISDNNPLYLLIEQLMHENVESNQYLSHKKACDAIVASLLLAEHKREKQLKLLFVGSNTLNQYIDALTNDDMRDELLLSVATLCKKYVQAITDHPSRDLGELVVKNTSIHEKVATSHQGLSRAVATALSHGISYDCKLGNHLLQMNRHERSFFHFLVKLRTLTGKSNLVFTANPDYTDFSTKQMDRLLRQLIGDAPLDITLTHESLNDSNADAYAKLLSCKNSLALTLIESDQWSDQNMSRITNALKERKSVKLYCDMVPQSEGYVPGFINYGIIKALNNVEVTVHDSVSSWRSRSGSWRTTANGFYKKMSNYLDRKCKLNESGVIFQPEKSKRSLLSLFSRKAHHQDENIAMESMLNLKHR